LEAISLAAVFLASFLASLVSIQLISPRLRRAGIVGADVHKPDRPKIPEMGGLALVAGFGAALLLGIGLVTFYRAFPARLVEVLAVLSTVLLVTLVGVLDDLLNIRQWIKALLPFVAALPLVVVRVGHEVMTIPGLGRVDFGPFYALILVPLGITGAANALNMLAGFNGLEVGMAAAAMAGLLGISVHIKATEATFILLAGLGSALGVLPSNWYPARVFIGDVGTLSLGAIIASAVILGNFEWAGIIVIIPYAVDFLFKAAHGFPSRGWWGELGSGGKLHCPGDGPVGLAQAVLKLTGGLHEQTLVLILIGTETMFSLAAFRF